MSTAGSKEPQPALALRPARSDTLIVVVSVCRCLCVVPTLPEACVVHLFLVIAGCGENSLFASWLNWS